MFSKLIPKLLLMGHNNQIYAFLCLLIPFSLLSVFILSADEFERPYRHLHHHPCNCSSRSVTRLISLECKDKSDVEESAKLQAKEEMKNTSGNPARNNTAENGLISYNDNRLLYKFYKASQDPSYTCVIRIVRFHRKADGNVYKNNEGNIFSECKAMPCSVEAKYSRDLKDFRDSDIAVLMESSLKSVKLDDVLSVRPPGQLWVLYSRECPLHEPWFNPSFSGNPYNFSMTFRTGSDITLPYGQYLQDRPSLLNIGKKSELMMWMASRCKPLGWQRADFVKALQEHLDVHIYGRCGTYDCPKDDWKKCLKIMQKYKFYLSLENSECVEYITEKMWKNAFATGMVPIVYGARKEDYVRLAPPNSFIHLNDFSTMEEFADYIKLLDRNETLYNKYFEWRKSGRAIRGMGSEQALNPLHLCDISRKMVYNTLYPDKSWRGRTPEFSAWWNQSCVHQPKLLGLDV